MRDGLPERLLLDWVGLRCVQQHVCDVQQRVCLPDVPFDWDDAVVWIHVCFVVPERHVPVWDAVPDLQQQLCDVQRDVDDVQDVPVWAVPEHADEHVRCVVPDRVQRDQLRLQPVPERLLWVVVHCLQLRDRRHLQRRDQRDGCVHVCDGLHAGDCWCCVQQLWQRVLPERVDVRGLRCQLHDVQQHDDVLAVRERSRGAAWEHVVCVDVPDGLLLERSDLPCVRLVVLDVLRVWIERVQHVQLRVVAQVPERFDVREQLPVWDVCQREQRVPAVQRDVCDVRDDFDHVRDVPEQRVPLPCERDVREPVSVWLVSEHDGEPCVLHVLPERDVRCFVHQVLLRDWRCLQLWVQRRWNVHVPDRVYAGDVWGCVQHVREWVLPEQQRDGVCGVPERLCGVPELDDVHHLL